MIVRYCFLFIKGLINVYTIKLIKNKKDRPHCIVSNSEGIILSMSLSLFV